MIAELILRACEMKEPSMKMERVAALDLNVNREATQNYIETEVGTSPVFLTIS